MKHDLVEILFNAVNEQGYLLSEAYTDLLSKRKTRWRIAAQEYPVTSGMQARRSPVRIICWLFGVSGPPEASECLCSGVGHLSGSSDKAPLISSRQLRIKFNLSTYSAKWWLEVKRNVASAKKIIP